MKTRADKTYEIVADLMQDLTPKQINSVLKTFGMFTYNLSHLKERSGAPVMDVARGVLFSLIKIERLKEVIKKVRG
jgi:hypothetical protein